MVIVSPNIPMLGKSEPTRNDSQIKGQNWWRRTCLYKSVRKSPFLQNKSKSFWILRLDSFMIPMIPNFCWFNSWPFWDGEFTWPFQGVKWPPTRGWKGHGLNHLVCGLFFPGSSFRDLFWEWWSHVTRNQSKVVSTWPTQIIGNQVWSLWITWTSKKHYPPVI